jgi:hypothetical protein
VTSPTNSTSIAFHRAMGFVIVAGNSTVEGVSFHKDYDGPGRDRVLFKKIFFTKTDEPFAWPNEEREILILVVCRPSQLPRKRALVGEPPTAGTRVGAETSRPQLALRSGSGVFSPSGLRRRKRANGIITLRGKTRSRRCSSSRCRARALSASLRVTSPTRRGGSEPSTTGSRVNPVSAIRWIAARKGSSVRAMTGRPRTTVASRYDVGARRDPHQRADRIDHRIEPLRLRPSGSCEHRRGKRHRGVDRQDDHLGPHHLAHEQDLERIDGVFAGDVVPAPRDLLGQDRSAEEQDGESVRHHRKLAKAPLRGAGFRLCSTIRYAAASSSWAMTSTIFS